MNMKANITTGHALPISEPAQGQPDREWALLTAIYRYRAEWNDYLARSLVDDSAPDHSKASYNVLRTWMTPAANWHEAEEALKLAFEELEAGDGPIIEPMLKAVIDWMQNERSRERFAVVQHSEPSDELVRIGKMIAEHRQTFLLWNEFCPFVDEMHHAFDPAMIPVVDLLNKREAELLQALINEPVYSVEAIQAKGAHLAAMHQRGSLSYESAFAFVASFHNPNVRIAR